MYVIRPSTPADLPFMADMLYEAATIGYVLRGVEPPSHDEVLSQPSNAHYLDGWGREGDAAVIAEAAAGEPLGAAWYRQFTPGDRGNGIVGGRACRK